MNRQPVESSMAASIGYDINNSILEIEFKKDGQVWQYYDVPENVYQELIAGSIGKYFLSNIKDQYSANRVL